MDLGRVQTKQERAAQCPNLEHGRRGTGPPQRGGLVRRRALRHGARNECSPDGHRREMKETDDKRENLSKQRHRTARGQRSGSSAVQS